MGFMKFKKDKLVSEDILKVESTALAAVRNDLVGAKKSPRMISAKLAVLSSTLIALIFSVVSFGLSWVLLGENSPSLANLEERREIVSSEGDVFNRIASEVGKSVVSIVVPSSGSSSGAAGTGVIISSSGLILTNKHVVAKASGQIEVVDYTNTKRVGRVIGRDSTNDIAFVQVDDLPKDIPAAKLADSGSVKVGDKVLAIGNALGEFQNTVTSGIVSGVGRPVDVSDEDSGSTTSLSNLIQTDAAINPGNSGGPLVNIKGEVVGINTAIVQDAQGLGFSIPINDTKALIAQIEQTGNLGEKAYLGVRYLSITESIAEDLSLPVSEGALVYNSSGAAVEAGSPADVAGLKAYDVIVEISGAKLNSSISLSSALSKFRPGQKVVLVVLRGSERIELSVTLGSTPNR